MNMSANMLGLDNAATPLGLKAMKELQQLNPEPETATDDQILFLVINASAVTLIPIAIFIYRAQLGAADPTDVFLPLLIATFCSTMAGILVTARVQKLPLRRPGGARLPRRGDRCWSPAWSATSRSLDKETLERAVLARREPADLHADRRASCCSPHGAGCRSTRPSSTAPRRGSRSRSASSPTWWRCWWRSACCAPAARSTCVLDGVRWVVGGVGLDTRWVDALPAALMRPLSGSGSRGLMIETMKTHGADSFAGRLACVIQGSTETTFYVLAVYFGSVGIKQHAPRRRLRPHRRARRLRGRRRRLLPLLRVGRGCSPARRVHKAPWAPV